MGSVQDTLKKHGKAMALSSALTASILGISNKIENNKIAEGEVVRQEQSSKAWTEKRQAEFIACRSNKSYLKQTSADRANEAKEQYDFIKKLNLDYDEKEGITVIPTSKGDRHVAFIDKKGELQEMAFNSKGERVDFDSPGAWAFHPRDGIKSYQIKGNSCFIGDFSSTHQGRTLYHSDCVVEGLGTDKVVVSRPDLPNISIDKDGNTEIVPHKEESKSLTVAQQKALKDKAR